MGRKLEYMVYEKKLKELCSFSIRKTRLRGDLTVPSHSERTIGNGHFLTLMRIL